MMHRWEGCYALASKHVYSHRNCSVCSSPYPFYDPLDGPFDQPLLAVPLGLLVSDVWMRRVFFPVYVSEDADTLTWYAPRSEALVLRSHNSSSSYCGCAGITRNVSGRSNGLGKGLQTLG